MLVVWEVEVKDHNLQMEVGVKVQALNNSNLGNQEMLMFKVEALLK